MIETTTLSDQNHKTELPKVFYFEDYRGYIQSRLDQMKLNGRGELSRLAKALDVNVSFMSQVLSGGKNLSQEQGYFLAECFGLNELETRYFNLLISLERATRLSYKKFIRQQIAKLKAEAAQLDGKNSSEQMLDERSQAIFYSSWQHSAIHLASGIPGHHSVKAIAARVGIDEASALKILNFLVNSEICQLTDQGYQVGMRRTHLPDSSPLRGRHHMNWRLKAIEKIQRSERDEVYYTSPMRIDEVTFQKMRMMILESIQNADKMVDTAGDQTLACLNVDLYRF